jgi:hypothetical protein
MQAKARSLVLGFVILAGGLGLLSTGAGSAADNETKSAQEAIKKVAALLAKGDQAQAHQAAAEAAKKYDLDVIMDVFKARDKKGVGIGPKPKVYKPDGIEAQFINMEKRAPAPKDAPAFAEAAYLTAAVAEIIVDKCPVQKKEKDKDPKEWKQWSRDMRQSALQLATALKANDRNAVKKAAKELNNSCTNCHGPFRQ